MRIRPRMSGKVFLIKPALRRELRNRPDVYRNKYLIVRAGYRYQNTLTAGHSAAENRGILELTSRYQFPLQLVVADRNRGNFRFREHKSFSTRYGNRLKLERDFTSTTRFSTMVNGVPTGMDSECFLLLADTWYLSPITSSNVQPSQVRQISTSSEWSSMSTTDRP